MPTTQLPDYYKILGAAVDADAAEIRRAFRRRVREVHPDVAVDKAGANEAFLRLKDAYAVLSDPAQRTNYDLQRANARARARENPGGPGAYRPGAGASRPGPGASARAGGARWDPDRKLTAAELLERAMNDMLAGRYQAARADLSEALANEPYNPDALVLMGRLYEAVGRHKEWIRVLEESLRKNPGQAALRLALNEARKAGTRKTETVELTDEQREQRRSAYKAVGITSAALAFLWGLVKPGGGTVMRDLMAAPGPLLIGTMLCALMTGWTMAAVSFIDPVDDELFFPDTQGRSLSRDNARNDAPLGLAVPFLALINYYMAVAIMAVLMLTRGVVSRSLLIVSGASFALAFAMAMAYPPEASSIMTWCPGWLLFAMFAGWFIGDFFRA